MLAIKKTAKTICYISKTCTYDSTIKQTENVHITIIIVRLLLIILPDKFTRLDDLHSGSKLSTIIP